MIKWRDPIKSIPPSAFPLSASDFVKQVTPLYQQYEDAIRICISDITKYAGYLAANCQDGALPELRELVQEMEEFWLSDLTGNHVGGCANGKYSAQFDQAILEARRSGCAPELSEQEKANVLSGLQLHRCEMEYTGGMISSIQRCFGLEKRLYHLWKTTPAMTPTGGMTLG